MPDESSVDPVMRELLRRWAESRGSPATPSPNEICADHPNRLSEFVALIESSSVPEMKGDTSEARGTPPATAVTDNTELPVGLAIAGVRYQGVRFHRRGGMGQVYVAHDAELRRPVALKRMKSSLAHHPDSQRRFLREAEITGRLQHPGIVAVYGLTQDAEGQPCYAMRFIEGRTLQEAIDAFHAADKKPGRDPSERRLAFRELLNRFVAVCQTMAYAHHQGVVHRDLKPMNVMLGPYGETLVVDWGLAKAVDSEQEAKGSYAPNSALCQLPTDAESSGTEPGQALGTPAYMSPEQAEGAWDRVGPSSDIYSLGATLFVILTGRAPVQSLDAKQGTRTSAREIKSYVPPALDAVCRKATALRPEDRYATASDLAKDVEQWLADEPVTAFPEPWTKRLSRWGRRHRTAVTGLFALLMTSVVGLAIGLVAVKHEQKQTEAARIAEAKRRRQTREALDAMSSTVIDDWLSKQSELMPEHRAFLEKSLASYEEFAADTGEDEATRAGVADAYLRVGNIRERLRQMADAEVAYLRCRDLSQQLADDFATVPEYRQMLAKSHNNLGLVQSFIGRLEEAESAFRQAIALHKQLAEASPAIPAHRSDLAKSQNNLGMLFRDTDRPQHAEAAFREALALSKQLVQDRPTVPEYRQMLGIGYSNLGNILSATDRLHDAEAAFREALTRQKQLAQDFPATPEYRGDLALSYNNIGNLFRDTDRPKEAETAFREALALHKQLAQDFPTVLEHRHNLASSHFNLGLLLTNLERIQDAESVYRAALTLYKQLVADLPNVPDFQNELAGTLVNLAGLHHTRKELHEARDLLQQAAAYHQSALAANPRHPLFREFWRDNRSQLTAVLLDLEEHAAAADSASELIRTAVEPSKDCYVAAGFLSRCSLLAKQDASLIQVAPNLCEIYADRAVAALRQAILNGYNDVDQMKKDINLDPLRKRVDFQKLQAECEEKSLVTRPPLDH